MKCSTCGNDNEENAQFCGGCGAALGVSPITSSTPQVIVDFPEAVKLGFQRYIDFSGRSSRAEYWWFTLFIVLVAVIVTAVDTVVLGTDLRDIGLLSTVWDLATLIPSLAIGVRRLHDIDKSGWWILLWFVLVIGWIVLIVWAIERGDKGTNKYGPDPRQATSQQPYKP
jgi:uncharacterized membrane protein YhaH (DUF805 family)